MGIRDLTKLLAKQAPTCSRISKLTDYSSKTIAIDTPSAIYQFALSNVSFQDTQNKYFNNHLRGMVRAVLKMKSLNITPIFVFSCGNLEKYQVKGFLEHKKKRSNKMLEYYENSKSSNNPDLILKHFKRSFILTNEQKDDIKQLVNLMGCKSTTSKYQAAEAEASKLAKLGIVDYVASEDMDCLPFGTTKLVKNFCKQESIRFPIIEYDLNTILQELELSKDSFLDLCILLGSDYSTRIRNIGPANSLRLIKEYNSIEEILKNLDYSRYTVSEDFNYKNARKTFLYPMTDSESPNITKIVPDENELFKFFVEKGLSREYAHENIKQLLF